MSLARCVRNLLHAIECEAHDWPADRVVTLAPLATSMAAMVAAVGRVAGSHVAARVRYVPDPRLEAQFGRWPLAPKFESAAALGFIADQDLEAIIRAEISRAQSHQ
jgi:hypothetical protein